MSDSDSRMAASGGILLTFLVIVEIVATADYTVYTFWTRPRQQRSARSLAGIDEQPETLPDDCLGPLRIGAARIDEVAEVPGRCGPKKRSAVSVLNTR